MKYRGALIPATAMPVYVELPYREALQMVKDSEALFLRYTTGPKKEETVWWHMVCRQYDFQKVSANTRSKIRRGMKRLSITRSDPLWLAEQGYECHRKSYQRYKHARPLPPEEFRTFLSSLAGCPIFDVWTCLKDDSLLGYIICLREAGGVFMHTIDITPEGLHDYAGYAMIHHVLDDYVSKKGLPVTNGSRSISHATDMQDFLLKFGFEREYAQLHVVYRPDVRLAVNLLYPFWRILKWFDGIPLIQKISSVLYQERILRRQTGF